MERNTIGAVSVQHVYVSYPGTGSVVCKRSRERHTHKEMEVQQKRYQKHRDQYRKDEGRVIENMQDRGEMHENTEKGNNNRFDETLNRSSSLCIL